MFEFSMKTHINAPFTRIWTYLIDLDNWWVASNTEHIDLTILSAHKALQKSTEIRIRAKKAFICNCSRCIF